MPLNTLDLSYIAGFFDGEGSVVLYRRKSGWAKRLDYALLVHITNTNRGVLDWVASVVGGCVYLEKSLDPTRRRPVYRWQATKNPAGFLRLIRPYVRLKKPQIDIALAFQETREVVGQPRRFRGGVPAAVSERREELRSALHVANRRGIVSVEGVT